MSSNGSILRIIAAVTVVTSSGTVPRCAHAQNIAPVNQAQAQSLAQNNAFNKNVGIQDFPIQLNVVLTNLTEGTRERIARETTDLDYRAVLQQKVVDPFERVRDNLKTASEDVTRASLNFIAQKPVNDVITQFNNVYKLIRGTFVFRKKLYYRRRFLSSAAIKEFYALSDQLQKVIDLHKTAVAQSP